MEDTKRIVRTAIKVGALLLAVITMLWVIRFGTFRSIKLNSFDDASSISFGMHMVKQKNTSFGRVNFKVANVNKFIDEVLLTQDSFEYTVQDQHYTYYVFNKNGYYYVAYAGLTTITIENLVSEYDIFQFPFFSLAPIIISEQEDDSQTVHTWDEINKVRYGSVVESVFTSYEDVLAFYEKVNPDYWQADDENETIQLKVFQKQGTSIFGETRISTEYYVTLVCTESGITVLYNDFTD